AVFHNSISSFRFLQFGGFPWKSFRTIQTGCPSHTKAPDFSAVLCGFGFRSDQSWSAATRLSCHTPDGSCNSAGL
ncbi:hypothetical protein, partial [Arthrobacter pullicola]|uniref:hypothetical protein n=1 Tax=Arthrobacter pullicola TaxID=2762224 RepID=UPI001CD81C64